MQETHYKTGKVLREFFEKPTEAEVRAAIAENAKKALLDANVRKVICQIVRGNEPCPCGSDIRFDLCCSPARMKHPYVEGAR